MQVLKWVGADAVAASLLACAAPKQIVWNKAGGTQEQYQRDTLTCRQYGMQSAQANGMIENMFIEVSIQREAANCLHGLRYYSTEQ